MGFTSIVYRQEMLSSRPMHLDRARNLDLLGFNQTGFVLY